MAKTKEKKEEKPKAHPLRLAWAGGVFDAQARIPQAGFVIRFESTGEERIREFHEIVGVGSVTSSQRRASFETWIFQSTNADDTRTLLMLLSPFLTKTKFRQAADMIARVERSAAWQSKYPQKAAEALTKRGASNG